jgi:ubiquinone/menaquinone biosynthesis C-methylase UbiE
MSKVFTTEITSESIPSDNPIHQRLLKPYVVAKDFIRGDVLEVGCGEGRGISLVLAQAATYSAIDKIQSVVESLKKKFPEGRFHSGNIPPLGFAANSFDLVLCFQVIEHIADDHLLLKEIHRVLRPGGVLLMTTPNRPMSLSRNPWHVREYTAAELSVLVHRYFPTAVVKGIGGSARVQEYYERNRASVQRLMKWDVFDLQHRLPAFLLRVPYELMNRLNRNTLNAGADQLVASITHEDYLVSEDAETSLDLFAICTK